MSGQQLCRLAVALSTDERRQANFQLPIHEPLHKVLSAAISGIGMQASEDRPTYFLRYQRKLLTNLSTPIRLAPFWTNSVGQGLVRLELVPIEALNLNELKLVQAANDGKAGSVLVALQSTQGRFQARFKPATNLWQCLLDFQSVSQT